MHPFLLFMGTGSALIALGLLGLLRQHNLVRKILAINVLGNGVFLLFITTAWRDATTFADPIPQAMVLTGIVVAVCATALGLALIERVQRWTGALDLPAEDGADEA